MRASHTFVRRHFGEEVVETVAGPLLAGVFGGDIEKLSARALLGPFVALEAQHGSLISGLQQSNRSSSAAIFTTLACGLGVLVDRLVQEPAFRFDTAHQPCAALNRFPLDGQ